MPARSPESLFAEWIARQGTADATPFEDLVQAHPDHAQRLRDLRSMQQELDKVLRHAGLAGSLAERLKSVHGSDVDPHVELEHEESGDFTETVLSRLSGRTPSSGRYHIKGEVAHGGMGAVLRVWDEDLRRHLAMKVMLGKGEAPTKGDTPPVDKRLLARFLEEAQVTGQLDHPGIVPVHELGLDADGQVYFTMKLVKGKTLAEVFDELHRGEGDWTQTRVLGLILKVCEAMSYAHAKGVIHRDLKPANIMVGKFGEVYVMDWGLAKILGREDEKDIRVREQPKSSEVFSDRREHAGETPDSPIYTMDGDVVGTPAYMSPEQAKGQLEAMGPHSDVYAVGAMLYHLLTGHMPYVRDGEKANNYAIWRWVKEGPPASLVREAPGASAELTAICDKAMARNVADRYRDTTELADDVSAYVEGRVVNAYQTGAWAETKKWVQRNRGLAAAVATAFVLLVTGMVTAASLRAQAVVSRDQAQWTAYVAAINAAQLALNSGETANTRRLLDAAPARLRNWEWGFLDAEVEKSDILVGLNGFRVLGLGHHYLATASSVDASLSIYPLHAGAPIAPTQGHAPDPHLLALSSDGVLLASRVSDRRVSVWNATNRKRVRLLQGHQAQILAACFDPSGSRVLTTSDDATARLWNIHNGAQTVLRGHSSGVLSGAFSQNGSRIVTASSDGTVRIWNSDSCQESVCLGPLEGTGHDVSAVFCGNDQQIATLRRYSRVQLWDVETGVLLHTLAQGTAIAVSPDGAFLVITRYGGSASIWDVETGAQLFSIGSDVYSAAIAPHNEYLVTASPTGAQVWDLGLRECLATLPHSSPVTEVAFSSNPSLVVTWASDGQLRLWDWRRPHENHTSLERGTLDGTITPDGTVAFLFPDEEFLSYAYDVLSGSQFPLSWQWQTCAFSGDGGFLATLGSEAVSILDAHTGVCVGRCGPVEWLTTDRVAINGDGTVVATVSRSTDTIQLWDTESSDPIEQFTYEGLWSAEFSPDGEHLYVSTDERHFLLSLSRKAPTVELDCERIMVWGDGAGEDIAFSTDGRRVATVFGDYVLVWDTSSGQVLAELRGHIQSINDLAFLGDGTRIVTASDDRSARIWDTSSATELLRLAHEEAVLSCAFRFDGRVATLTPTRLYLWDSVRRSDRRSVSDKNLDRPVLDCFLRNGSNLQRTFASLRSESGSSDHREHMHEYLAHLCHDTGRWIRQLMSACPLIDEVKNAVEADRTRPSLSRYLALSVLQHALDDPEYLNGRAWDIVVDGNSHSAGALECALRCARRCVEASPDDSAFLNTLGVALYRLGQFREAQEVLERSDSGRRSRGQSRQPFDVAFLAMSLSQIGLEDRAREEYAALHTILPENVDQQLRGVLEEASALLGHQ